MNDLKLCVVDTNVAKIADLSSRPDPKSDVPSECILACLEAIENAKENKGLVLDDGNEILNEYQRALGRTAHFGIGKMFVMWVRDNLPYLSKVKITKKEAMNGDSFEEFPDHKGLSNFDPPDRKFVAVSNAHPQKPVILQATDSKWWGWKDALEECGIKVQFLCPDYIRAKYKQKIGE